MFQRDITNYLKRWKNSKGRKPLILRGARQVGKTTAVKMFGEKEFDNSIGINLEKSKDFELFKNVTTIDDFKKTIEIAYGKQLIPGKTLLFIDEIQNTPNLIELLRFFYEDLPELHIIATGSLLEVQIEKQGLEMPVGRIEYAYLHPLTFFEFLNAVGEVKLFEFLKKIDMEKTIPDGIHLKALKLFNEYALIGGMPEIVARHIRKDGQEKMTATYFSLLTAYGEDIYKYASQADVKYISYALEQAPYFAGERITYNKFGGSLYKSREMSEAFATLEKAMLLTQVRATKSIQIPLVGGGKRAKKLLYLDVGLVNFKNEIQSKFLGIKDLSDIYRGKIAEQVVGQNLIASEINRKQTIYYWGQNKSGSSAEVDFCLVQNGNIFGIEVKSGNSFKLKSLFSFGSKIKDAKLVRVYAGELKQEEVKYFNKKYKLLSVPFYLVNRIIDLK